MNRCKTDTIGAECDNGCSLLTDFFYSYCTFCLSLDLSFFVCLLWSQSLRAQHESLNKGVFWDWSIRVWRNIIWGKCCLNYS